MKAKAIAGGLLLATLAGGLSAPVLAAEAPDTGRSHQEEPEGTPTGTVDAVYPDNGRIVINDRSYYVSQEQSWRLGNASMGFVKGDRVKFEVSRRSGQRPIITKINKIRNQ